jgi:hypothetical protein
MAKMVNENYEEDGMINEIRGRKGFQLSIGVIVIIIIGIIVIGLGVLLLGRIFDFIPAIGGDKLAPPIIDVGVVPENGQVGTVFKIGVKVPTRVDVKDVIATIDSKTVRFIFDGSSWIGYWDSEESELGVVSGDLKIYSEGGVFDSDFEIEVNDNSCKSLMVNGASDDKIDLVFLGQGFESVEDFENKVREYVDFNGLRSGIFGFNIFKDNKDRFNVYMIDRVLEFEDLECEVGCKGIDSLVCCNNKKVARAAGDCAYDEIAILINEDRFCGSASDYAKVCTGQGSGNKPMVLVHEFGHSFGGLGDEYDYGVHGGLEWLKDYSFPNCVKDCADWPVGVNAGCFAICGYSNYFRSEERNSIMYGYFPVFNDVSKLHLEGLFEDYDLEVVNNLPAPLDESKYVIEFGFDSSGGGSIEFDDVYLVPGGVRDYNSGGRYKVEILDSEGGVLDEKRLDIVQINYPFFEEGSGDRPAAIFEEDLDLVIELPFYEFAGEVLITDLETDKNWNVGVDHLNNVCEEEVCDSVGKGIIGGRKPIDEDGSFFWLWIISIGLIVAVIIAFILLKDKPDGNLKAKKSNFNYQ